MSVRVIRLSGIGLAVAFLSPLAALAQDTEIVRLAIAGGVEASVGDGATGLPPVLCVGVQPAGASGIRDVVAHEVPVFLPDSVRIVGFSECRDYRTGARHEASGQGALIYRVTVEGRPATGRASFVSTWFESGERAGTRRCDVIRREDRWMLAGCTTTPEGKSAGG